MRKALVLFLCLVACGEKGGANPTADKPLGQPPPPAKIASAAPSAVAPASAAPELASAASAPASASGPVASATGSGSAGPLSPTGPAPVAKADKLDKLPRGKKGILTQAQADKLIATGSAAQVTLLEAGSAPREKLVYAIPKGTTYKGGLGLETTLKIKVPEQPGGKGGPAPGPQEVKMPKISMVLDMTALDRDAKNEVSAKGVLAEMTMDGVGAPQIKQVNDQLAKMKGLEMTYWIQPDGRTRDFNVKVPPDVPKEVGQFMNGLTSQMDQIMVSFPKEDVGVGAKWSVLSRVAATGMDVVQLTKYTLVERKGSVLKLSVEVEQVAAKDTIVPPGGMGTAKLLSFASAGKGDIETDVKTLGPKTSTMKVDMKMELEATVGGKTDRAAMDMTLGVEFKQK